MKIWTVEVCLFKSPSFWALDSLKLTTYRFGDGGYITEMERWGYATAGPWTPQVNAEHPHKQVCKEQDCKGVKSGQKNFSS